MYAVCVVVLGLQAAGVAVTGATLAARWGAWTARAAAFAAPGAAEARVPAGTVGSPSRTEPEAP